jgi:DNA modification methylase
MSEKVVIGDAELWQGDCAEILNSIPFCDLVLTDPPYGIGESSKKQKTRGSLVYPPTDYGFYDWDQSPPKKELLNAIIAKAKHAILWGGNYFGLPAASKILVWDKISNGDFSDCELAWTNLPGAVRIFRHMWTGYLRDSERNVQRVHPTQKPVVLMGWCLGFAPQAQVVFDPYMGSGTTGVACARLNKKFIGIERDQRYFDISCERISQAYMQKDLFSFDQVIEDKPSVLLNQESLL